MVSHEKYVAGWLDSSIGEFLETFPRDFASLKYALITCLDSNADPASLLETSPALHSIQHESKRLGQGLLLPSRILFRDEMADEIFFGFDEVWFFPHELREPKPTGGSLVGPARVNQQRLDQLGHWLSANSCMMGLGDGCGLNYVVKAQGLVRYILGHSLEQTENATASTIA